MGYKKKLRLVGGSRDGEVIPYGEPLPHTVVFQRLTPSGWIVDDYTRVGETMFYEHRSERIWK